jgi:hypothetical protein
MKDPRNRKVGKMVRFGDNLPWSMPTERIRELAGIDEALAEELRDRFFSAFPNLKGPINGHRPGESNTPGGLCPGSSG